MDFALCPDDGPPRLIRYDLKGDALVSVLTRSSNLLRVNRTLYDALSALNQSLVLRTQEPLLWFNDGDPTREPHDPAIPAAA